MHYYFDGEDQILQHWNQGLGSHYLPYEEIKKTSLDNTVSFRSLAKRKIIRDCKQSGRTFYYIDTGYVGNLIKTKLYHRVVKNDVQHSTVFDAPDDRWRKIQSRSPELEFVEWRKNHKGKILLVTPSEKPCKFYNIDRDRWVADTIETFLDARANDSDSFTFTPPGESSSSEFVCEGWSKSIPFNNRATIQATFRQVFEPAS